MNNATSLESIDTNLWIMDYPLKMLGVNMHRVVTIIRLSSGKLIVHSSAPFTTVEADVIRELGKPEWLVDVLLRHDTFAVEGHAAFPDASYLAPEGFSKDLPFPTGSLLSPPIEWEGEVEVIGIDGAPDFSEIVMFHRPSRTLIVGDLIVNFIGEQGWWSRVFAKLATVGGRSDPGVTKPFQGAIKDRSAFSASVNRVLEWDFDRVIVGHGLPISSGGKEKMRTAMQAAGLI